MVIGQILGVEKMIAVLGDKQDKVVKVLKTEVRQLAVMLMGYIKQSKLTGEVLHVRTGRLRRSITSKVVNDGPLVVGVVGTNVVYAKAHEFGVDKHMMVTVHEYLRRCKSRNTYAIKNGRRAVRDEGGKVIGHMLKRVLSSEGVAHVGEFQRNQHIHLPERSFLRSALADLGPDIRADLAEAIQRAIR